MKYVFLAIGFFSLGYALPSLPSLIQLVTAIFAGLLLLLALCFYVSSEAYSHIVE